MLGFCPHGFLCRGMAPAGVTSPGEMEMEKKKRSVGMLLGYNMEGLGVFKPSELRSKAALCSGPYTGQDLARGLLCFLLQKVMLCLLPLLSS